VLKLLQFSAEMHKNIEAGGHSAAATAPSRRPAEPEIFAFPAVPE